MTIRDMEWKSGLDRTNIRFYEREGLLTPERRENGYRDYSEADLQLLLKIKLLRRLGFSLEAIRALKNGDTALDEALARRLAAIDGQRRELDATEYVCSEMRQDGASFPTLDAQRYLSAYDQALRAPAGIRSTVPESDRVESVRCPWRRYFARAMDLSLASLLIHLVLALGFRANMSDLNDVVDWVLGLLSWLLLVPLEALALSRWGSTPGKWLMGLRLEHADGRLLTFGEAASRAGMVFYRGEGLTIPFYNLYRLWKSYKAVSEGSGVEWDEDVNYIVSDLRWWHPVRYIGAEAVQLLVLTVFVLLIPMMPVNRGADLTVEEFVENYNRQAKYLGADDLILQEDGTLVRESGELRFPAIIFDLNENDPPILQWTVQQGVLTEIRFQREVVGYRNSDLFDLTGRLAAQLAVRAFAWSDAPFWTPIGEEQLADALSRLETGTLEQIIHNCHMTYTVQEHTDFIADDRSSPNRYCTVTFHLYRLPQSK